MLNQIISLDQDKSVPLAPGISLDGRFSDELELHCLIFICGNSFSHFQIIT